MDSLLDYGSEGETVAPAESRAVIAAPGVEHTVVCDAIQSFLLVTYHIILPESLCCDHHQPYIEDGRTQPEIHRHVASCRGTSTLFEQCIPYVHRILTGTVKSLPHWRPCTRTEKYFDRLRRKT